MSFSRLFRYLLRDSVFFGTLKPGNANAGGSAKCIHTDLLPDDAVVTHVTICQGRDHIVNVRSSTCTSSLS